MTTTSPLMSETEALAYLAVDKRRLSFVMLRYGLRRHPAIRTVFAREDVERVAATMRKEIMQDDEGTVGSEEPPVGGEPWQWERSTLVP